MKGHVIRRRRGKRTETRCKGRVVRITSTTLARRFKGKFSRAGVEAFEGFFLVFEGLRVRRAISTRSGLPGRRALSSGLSSRFRGNRAPPTRFGLHLLP